MRILIIDDEPSVADLFSRLAAIHGFTDIDIVSTSEEAVTHVLRARYDLITLDIRMPGASGLEIIAILRNMNPHAVIAVISGHLPEQIPDEVLSCVDTMLAKPVPLEIFTQLLEGALQVSEMMVRLRDLGSHPIAIVN